MKIALVHDYIKEYGGAERVLEALHELWPDAPVFTSVYLPSYLGPHKDRFNDWTIKTSWLQFIPFKQKLISPMRLLSSFAFRSFDFSKFDVVIVSATGAYFPNVINSKKATHICYCHTPPRYLYGYATAREWRKHRIFRALGEIANHFLRLVDFEAAQNVDEFIANSHEVQARIQKFYRREAKVMYPPVEVQNYELRIKNQGKKDYYLAGGRLARSKGIDVIVEAFGKLDKPLKIFGRGFGGYDKELKMQRSKINTTNQSSKIEFIGEVSDEEKLELMAGTRAFVFASKDEDFGITPVEAMSVGTPVIAYNGGGVKETVVEGKTGVFYQELSSDALTDAVKRFEKLSISSESCIKRAQEFSKQRFQKEIKAFVEALD